MPNYQYSNKVACPRCGSIQVKSMIAQPKKYPRPTDPDLLSDWQYGYDCKRCGSEFVIEPSAPTEEPPKKGFFATLVSLIIKIFLAIVIILVVLAFLTNREKEESKVQDKPDAIEQIIHEKAAEPSPAPEVNMPTVQELNEAFPLDAEQAAHEEYPKDPTKANSQ